MKIPTIFHVLLLFMALHFFGCASKNPAAAGMSIEDAEKQIAKKEKKQAKEAKKAKKKADKHFWSLQSKEVRKSVKANQKRQKKRAKQRNKGS